jgi:hypothetical protein
LVKIAIFTKAIYGIHQYLIMKSDKTLLALASLIILTSISWIASCTHEPDLTKISTICYDNVKSIIGNNCAMKNQGCHDNNGEAIDLSTNLGISNSVVAGNADASPLYKAITSVRGQNKMPPDHPISQEFRTTIRIWIEQGADTLACKGVK